MSALKAEGGRRKDEFPRQDTWRDVIDIVERNRRGGLFFVLGSGVNTPNGRGGTPGVTRVKPLFQLVAGFAVPIKQQAVPSWKCAWCDRFFFRPQRHITIYFTPPKPPANVSHGACDACVAECIAEAREGIADSKSPIAEAAPVSSFILPPSSFPL